MKPVRWTVRLAAAAALIGFGATIRMHADEAAAESPHAAALRLVFEKEQKRIADIEKKKDPWFDVKTRSWLVTRPYHPGVVDTTHSFDVEYQIEGRTVGYWGVDTARKGVSFRKDSPESKKARAAGGSSGGGLGSGGLGGGLPSSAGSVPQSKAKGVKF